MKILSICLIMIVTFLSACSNSEIDLKNDGYSQNSGEDFVAMNSLSQALIAYKNVESEADCFSILFLDDSDMPFLFNGYKFYHYENGNVREIPGYTVDRLDRTTLYVKKNMPFILEIYNIFGEQSWKIYKYENNEFINLYDSGSYLVAEDSEINDEGVRITDEISQNIDENINKLLNTIDYTTEYKSLAVFDTLDNAVKSN